MPDIISGLTTVISIAKQLRDVSQKIKDADTKNLIADLSLALADLKMQVAELQEQNLSLRADLKKAAEQEDVRENVVLRDGMYYLATPMFRRPDGPYCTACIDSGNKLIVLRELTGQFRVFGTHQCPICKAHYGPSQG